MKCTCPKNPACAGAENLPWRSAKVQSKIGGHFSGCELVQQHRPLLEKICDGLSQSGWMDDAGLPRSQDAVAVLEDGRITVRGTFTAAQLIALGRAIDGK